MRAGTGAALKLWCIFGIAVCLLSTIAGAASAVDPAYYCSPTWQTGQWAEYNVVEDNVIPCPNSYWPDGNIDFRVSENSAIKVSIVGTDTVNGKTYYWYEFKQTKSGYWYFPTNERGKAGVPPPLYMPGQRTVVVKILVDGPEFRDVRRYQVKIDNETPKEYTDGYLAAVPGEIRDLLGKRSLKADIVLMEGGSSGYNDAVSGNKWAGQRFMAKSAELNGVSLDIKRVAGQDYDLVVELYDDSLGHPGVSLAKEVVPYSKVSTTGGLVDVVFTWPVPTYPSNYYHVIAHLATTTPGSTTVYQWRRTSSTSTYPYGYGESANQGTSWASLSLDYKIAILREMDQAIEEDIINDAVCSSMADAIGGNTCAAQSFKIRQAANIYGVALDVKRLENYDLVVEIRADANGLPGTVLRSKVLPYEFAKLNGKFVRVDFEEPLSVSPGNVYHLAAHTLGNQGTAGGSYQWRLTDQYLSKYPDGEQESSSNGGVDWTRESGGRDLTFAIMESDPTEAGWSLIKPFCHWSDVVHNDRWGAYDSAIGGTSWAAQEFRPNKSNITGVTLDLKRLEDIDLTVELYDDAGGLPGASLASKTVPYTNISQQGGYLTVFFSSPVAVTAGNPYHVVLHTLSGLGVNGGSYGWRLGNNIYSTYLYGEAEKGTSGAFSDNDPSGRDYYIITHYLNPQAQELISADGSFNTDRVVSNRGAVTSWLTDAVPVTGIVRRASGEGIGIQRISDSISTKQDDLSSLYWDSAIGGDRQCAQQVVAKTAQISGASFYMKRVQDFDLVVELMGDNLGKPDNIALARATVPYNSISTTGGWLDVYFDNPILVSPGAVYHIVIHTAGFAGSNGASYLAGLTSGTASTYSLGEEETATDTSWADAGNGRDMAFKLRYARSDRFHCSYQTLTLSAFGQTGAASEISDPVELSLKSAVPNSDGVVVNSSTLLGGFRYDSGLSSSDTIKQDWFNAGGNYSPSVFRYDIGQAERAFSDSKPYYYGTNRNWHTDLFDKWRSGMKGICWQDEPYAIQCDASKTSAYLSDASSEAEASRKFEEYVRSNLTDKYRFWASQVVPSYDGGGYPLGHNVAAGADIAMIEEWLNGPPSYFLYGITLSQTSDILKINNAVLRGCARSYGKIWGRGAYHGLIMNGWASTVLKSAFNEGADYLLYWVDVPADYSPALASIAEMRAYINARRQSEYLPDTVVLLPKDFGYLGYTDGTFSWGIGKDGKASMTWEEYHWKDVMQDFYAKVKSLLTSGLPFDIAYDGNFKSYLYKSIYRFNGTEGNWWDSNWHWRLPVSLGMNSATLPAGSVVQVAVDFQEKLKAKGVVNPDLDEQSIRVLVYNRSTHQFSLIPSNQTEFNDMSYNGQADAANNGRGDVRFKLEVDLAANSSKVYYIYFDTTSNGSKPAWGTALGAAVTCKVNAVRLPMYVDINQYESGFTGSGSSSPGGASPMGSLTGQVQIQGITGDNWLSPIGIELLQGGTVVRRERLFLDANWNYVLSEVSPGTYDIAFSGPKSLRKIVNGVVVSGGEVTMCNVSLDTGDLDGDGVVGDSDMDILRKSWGLDGN